MTLPDSALQPFGVESQDPDSFLLYQLALSPGKFLNPIRKHRAGLKNPPINRADSTYSSPERIFSTVLINDQQNQIIPALRHIWMVSLTAACQVQAMVKASLDARVQRNVAGVLEGCRRDIVVDSPVSGPLVVLQT